MSWDPAIYMQFAAERTRPAGDLLARIPNDKPRRIVDLGCGPGNSTELLAACWPDAQILAIDSSPEMIEKAQTTTINAQFVVGDFESWEPEHAPDVIYANAAFQWSNDPVALVRRLFAHLAPGGVLAFQVPQNFDQPSHVIMREVAANGPWADKLDGARWYDPGGFARAQDYARALTRARRDVWTTDYLHILRGPDPVFRWMSGTGLRPFLDRLEGDERVAFEDEIMTRFAAAYPLEPDGSTFFPFRRLFVIAARH